ncbi:MAG: LPS export ABC transporter permease LptF [Proteobacteria bacterium]|nr:LPS export ABC transporter permease LptF [Pseudomonadota bacterium]
MIFHRALLREFTSLAGAVFMTLFLISLTVRLIRLLGQAAGGKLPSDAVVAFLGFFSLNALPILLSLTLFITVLLTLTRSYRDSEMVIWFNSGLSVAAWVKPVMMFSAPLIAVIATLSLFISPWAVQKSEEYRVRIDSRDEVSRVSPGVFGESTGKDRVFFVESTSGDSTTVQNVFVNSVQHRKTGIMMSNRGFVEVSPIGDRFLVLLNGRRYEGNPGEAEFKVMEFERYATRIEAREGDAPLVTQKSLSTFALLESPTSPNLGELVWRIGVPVSAVILALLAIPMSFVNPRAGRSVNLLFALLTYMVYSNMLSLSQARVVQGKLSFGVGIWLVHGVMVAVLLVLFARRTGALRLRR